MVVFHALAAAIQVAASVLLEPVVPTNGPEPVPGLDGLAGSFIGWIKWILVLAGVGA